MLILDENNTTDFPKNGAKSKSGKDEVHIKIKMV